MRTSLKASITGLLLGAFTMNSMGAVFQYNTGTTIKFAPSATIAGINVGSVAGDPSAPLNGDIWYDSTANELTARINGANVALGSGSGSGNALTTDPLSQFAATTSAQLKSVLSDELGDASGKAIFALGTLAISSGKTLTSSNTLTLAGTDGSTLNIGAGGTLGAAALLGTSAGGNGTADNGKAAIFGTGGILDATTELTVHNSATAAHAYLTDDGTIGFHAVGELNPRELVFPTDVLENEAKEIATKDWVGAQGYGSGGALTATYIGYGGAGNSLTGEAAFSYDATTNTATIENIGATSVSAGALAFEGATADAFETSVAVVDPTADRTFTIPNASGTAILTASNVAQAVDLGGDTSFEVPNGAAPTVDAFGEIAGDNNLWATGRGAPIFYDGTAATALVNVLVSDTPTNGQVPKWNTGGTITWEDDTGGSGSGDFVGPASSTDNAIVRFDSTTGKLGQNSTITIDDTGAVTVPEMAAPATPAAGKVSFYAKSDGLLYSKDDAGTETVVTGGGGSGSSPTTTRGDLIRRGASADERLAIGGAGAQLVSDGTDAQWRARSKYASWYDEFCWGNATVPVGEIGWNSSGSLTTGTAPTAGHPGLVSLAGASGTTDYCRLYSNVASIALGGGVFRYETVIKTGDLSTGTDEYDLRMGLGDSPGPFTDGVYFEYDRNAATNWRCGVAKAGSTTENEGAAPVAVAANTYYKLAFVVNAAASSVSFYIDGTLLHTIADANVPNTDSNLMGFYYLIIKSAGSALPAFQIDYLDADYTLTTAR